MEQKSGVRRWVGIQADPSVNPGVIVITIVLLIRILPHFHMIQYQVVLGLKETFFDAYFETNSMS